MLAGREDSSARSEGFPWEGRSGEDDPWLSKLGEEEVAGAETDKEGEDEGDGRIDGHMREIWPISRSDHGSSMENSR